MDSPSLASRLGEFHIAEIQHGPDGRLRILSSHTAASPVESLSRQMRRLSSPTPPQSATHPSNATPDKEWTQLMDEIRRRRSRMRHSSLHADGTSSASFTSLHSIPMFHINSTPLGSTVQVPISQDSNEVPIKVSDVHLDETSLRIESQVANEPFQKNQSLLVVESNDSVETNGHGVILSSATTSRLALEGGHIESENLVGLGLTSITGSLYQPRAIPASNRSVSMVNCHAWKEATCIMAGNKILGTVRNDYVPESVPVAFPKTNGDEQTSLAGPFVLRADEFPNPVPSSVLYPKEGHEDIAQILEQQIHLGMSTAQVGSVDQMSTSLERDRYAESGTNSITTTPGTSLSPVHGPVIPYLDYRLSTDSPQQLSPLPLAFKSIRRATSDHQLTINEISESDFPDDGSNQPIPLYSSVPDNIGSTSLAPRRNTEQSTASTVASQEEVPDWISDMRKAWDTEIQNMDADSRSALLERRNSRSSRTDTGTWISSFFARFSDKELAIPKEKIERIYAKYTCFLPRRESNLKELLQLEALCRKEVLAEITVFRQNYQRQLISLCRRVWQHKLARVFVQQDIERNYIATLKHQIDEMNEFFRSGSINYYGAKIVDPAQIPQQNPQIRANMIMLKCLDGRIRELDSLWTAVLRRVSAINIEERRKVFIEIINNTQHNPELSYHEWVEDTQTTFDRLILDERSAEGRKLKKYIDIINRKTPEEVTPEDVVDFVHQYADELAKDWGVDVDHEVSTVRMYTMRTIFPRVQKYCRQYKSEEDHVSDILYTRRLRRLRSYSPEEFSINPKFLPNHGSLLQEVEPVLDLLGNVGLMMVPADMNHCILKAGRKLTQIVHKMAARIINFGADDIFPIFVYCIVHAEIPNIHANLRYMELFCPSRDAMTEHGYWATTLRGSYRKVNQNIYRNQ
eukprot:TRINITY_DN6812_c0_g1_i2.p1 TRINITY_DN6812_c0_g1~~TRINITY_DN6812_c0_g1_i2.p1  ORF type:complete len:916 (+),score=141.42 TRINITY_DN6812_c0_g1_i2:67-2814(+)